jgi:phosphatidylinositol glycan class Z
MPTTQTWNKLLLLIRFIFIFTTGYIHPDEFFQSPSPTATFIIPHYVNSTADPLLTTWEFTHPSPQRSMLIPLLVVGPSFYILRIINYIKAPALLYAPRIALFLSSLVVDSFADKVLNHELGKLLFRSLWPVILFHTRPFSNTTEAFMLTYCLYVTVCVVPSRGPKWYLYILLGAISSVGCFIRFTFPMFAWPGVWCAIFNQPMTSLKNNSFMNRLLVYITRLLFWLIGFVITSFTFVSFDTWYFSKQRGANIGWVIAPLNNLLYNMDVKNLAEHTLHARYLHALINMPMLYGPLYVVLACVYARNAFSTITSFFSFFTKWFVPNQSGKEELALVTVISGLGLISLAQHQEPRFLIPLTLPICMLAFAMHERKRINLGGTIRWIIVFSLAMCVFFGMLHQAGVLPSLFYLDTQKGHAIYHHTYMPPSYLLLGNKDIKIHDLGGGDVNGKLQSLLNELNQTRSDQDIFVVSGNDLGVECAAGERKNWPSLSTESWKTILAVCKVQT